MCIDLELCESLVRHLNRLRDSGAGEQITQLARDARKSALSAMQSWAELRHMMSRILAYEDSIEFLWRAGKTWPELFDHTKVKITSVPSSQPWEIRTRDKSFAAEDIIRRTTKKPDMIKTFQNFIDESKFLVDSINKEIREGFHNFGPIVHSEVLLHHILSQDISRANFFKGWRYIGSSKSICKLCHDYFEKSKSTIGHRPTHGNLYVNWRLPHLQTDPISKSEKTKKDNGKKEEDANWQVLHDRMVQASRDDLFALIKKKALPKYKRHDSITSTSRITSHAIEN